MSDRCESVVEKVSTAKERVQHELEEVKERIVKLSNFVFSKEILETEFISVTMKQLLERQLSVMQEYAKILQARLIVWGKTDGELNSRRPI